MASITIRDLPTPTKEALRVKAAKAGVSLEAYVRQLLRHASEQHTPHIDIVDSARRHFGKGKGVDLELPVRRSARKPVRLEA